jgi:hypothetical protein
MTYQFLAWASGQMVEPLRDIREEENKRKLVVEQKDRGSS